MHLLALEEYGLRCLLRVASHAGADPLTIPAIAEAEGLSPEYAAKLLRKLRIGGLLTSARGAGGGYRLARPADQITIWEAVDVLGGEFFPASFCECHGGQRNECVRLTDCSLRALWRRLDETLRETLEAITVQDLARREPAVEVLLDRGASARRATVSA
ncbi:MAG: Rrf2 family transcriptional regulator [Deltaproteobacteria bacterium]|nr:MAG: Rrf2 family transcriptional regulator [Deltaproteobacteria bacterium]